MSIIITAIIIVVDIIVVAISISIVVLLIFAVFFKNVVINIFANWPVATQPSKPS